MSYDELRSDSFVLSPRKKRRSEKKRKDTKNLTD